MKRSRSIELAIMSTVPLALSACVPRDPIEAKSPLIYQSVQQCIDEHRVAEDVCRRAYDQSTAQNAKDAPHFSSLDDCAARYGYDQCHSYRGSDGSHWFMPALAGYMIGTALQRNRDDRRANYGGGWSSEPVYKERGDRGAWRTGDGETVGHGNGARGPAATPSTAETLSRGGFGSSAAARGSWGG